jgi:GNAT superfamily N-acetyltransferase
MFFTGESVSERKRSLRQPLVSWEIQVSPSSQGKGLGGVLMGHLKTIARRSGMAKVMLTVLRGELALTTRRVWAD